MDTVSDVLQKRHDKVETLKRSGVNLYPNDFRVTHDIAEIHALVAAAPETLTEQGPRFTIAGRLMAVNHFGKAAFVRVRDRSGQLQAYVRRDRLGEEAFAFFKQLDIGDFAGLTGTLFQTRTGEWTLMADSLRLLSKSVRPLPEKFHGLKDPEKRYRQRYIDLVMNPDVREIFMRRSRMIQEIRAFFLERGYLEVETPMMQPIPGGAEATPFKTHHNALGMDLYLRIAPELYLKRLVVGGFERVFEINRNFRNEGVSTQHNPEFTMVEFYQAYADYTDLMDLTETLMARVAEAVTGSADGRLSGADHRVRRAMAPAVAVRLAGRTRGGPAGRPGRPRAAARLCRRAQGDGHENRQARQGGHQALRRAGAAAAAAADLHHRLPGRGVAAVAAQRPHPRADRALRAVHRRAGDRQRLLRAERPGGPARAVPAAGQGARGRATPRPTGWTTTTSRPSSTGCPRRRGRASGSTGWPCC